MTFEDNDHPPGFHIPDAGRLVARCSHNSHAVRTESGAPHYPFIMPPKHCCFTARPSIPNTCGRVRGRGNDAPSVWAEAHTHHLGIMAPNSLDRSACLGVPDTRGSII